MEALAHRDPARATFAKDVRFTENGVGLRIGEGFWGSARGKALNALRVADPKTGNVAWYGVVSDHDLPAYYDMRLNVIDRRIAEVESFVARARNPGPFGDTARFTIDSSYEQTLANSERQSRQRMVALVQAYTRALNKADGSAARIAPTCKRTENGVDIRQATRNPGQVSEHARDVRGIQDSSWHHRTH